MILSLLALLPATISAVDCKAGYEEYFDECFPRSHWWTDWKFADTSVSEHVLHVQNQKAYNEIINSLRSTDTFGAVKYTKDAVIENFGDNWNVMLVSPYDNAYRSRGGNGLMSFSGSGDYPRTELQGLIRMAGNYWSGGPFLHEIAHNWGVGYSSLRPNRGSCSGHWGWTGHDVWPQLGGFLRRNVFCTNGKKPTKRSPCSNNKLIFVSQRDKYSDGKGEPTSHSDYAPYSKFERYMMGLYSESEMNRMGEEWIYCDADCKPNSRVNWLSKGSFNPDSYNIKGFEDYKDKRSSLDAFVVDCHSVKYYTASDMEPIRQNRKDLLKPGGTLSMITVLVYPESVSLPRSSADLKDVPLAAENYMKKLEGYFWDATGQRAKLSVSTGFGRKVQTPNFECTYDSQCRSKGGYRPYCNLHIWGNKGRCDNELDASKFKQSCFMGLSGFTYGTTSFSVSNTAYTSLKDALGGDWKLSPRKYNGRIVMEHDVPSSTAIYQKQNEKKMYMFWAKGDLWGERWIVSKELESRYALIFCDNLSDDPWKCKWKKNFNNRGWRRIDAVIKDDDSADNVEDGLFVYSSCKDLHMKKVCGGPGDVTWNIQSTFWYNMPYYRNSGGSTNYLYYNYGYWRVGPSQGRITYKCADVNEDDRSASGAKFPHECSRWTDYRGNSVQPSWTFKKCAGEPTPVDYKKGIFGPSELIVSSNQRPTPRPVSPTPRPISPTPRPISPTPRPISPTPRPISPTPRPISPTPRPVSPTPRPISPTPRPIASTPRPTRECPVCEKCESCEKCDKCDDCQGGGSAMIPDFDGKFMMYDLWCQSHQDNCKMCKGKIAKEGNGRWTCSKLPQTAKKIKCKSLTNPELCQRAWCTYIVKRGKGKCAGKSELA